MLHVHSITTLDHPGIQPYLTMRWQQEHREQRIFVAEGEKVVRRLLESELEVVSLLLPQKWVENLQPLLARRAETDIHAFVAPKEALEQLAGYTMYQGVLAVGRIPPALTLAEALQCSTPPRLFAAVDGVANAENLGSLVRNCAAFGVQALLVSETCSSPWLRRAVRASMGTIYDLPVVEPVSLATTLRDLRLAGVRCVAAHPHTDRRTLAQAELRGDCCLVFGSEGNGLSKEVLAACDEAVLVPMSKGVDSLNVGAAAAVFLYEAARQRGRG
jgi:tRNA G18 (ribose-2'-O)-methylase SpoU